MDDPGRKYLYSTPKSSDHTTSARSSMPPHSVGACPPCPLAASAVAQTPTHTANATSPPGGAAGATRWASPAKVDLHHEEVSTAGRQEDRKKPLTRWDMALGNIGDAENSLQQLRHLVDDAVYLDEDAYNGVASLSHYTRTIQ
eukprot:scaffold131881_cov35-Prasinocladus_malaysianus.AAC.1